MSVTQEVGDNRQNGFNHEFYKKVIFADYNASQKPKWISWMSKLEEKLRKSYTTGSPGLFFPSVSHMGMPESNVLYIKGPQTLCDLEKGPKEF